MARKSRKNQCDVINAVDQTGSAENRTGIYIRLSVEDNGHKTKDSIQNQTAFLREFVDRNREEFQLVDIYVDNGTTGTNFDRENWNRLLGDIKSQQINCIIVKDFSRIGRNYLEVGDYLEKIFPFLGVRVVSVNDHFDSSRQIFQSDMLMNSLANIVNEYYARDISRKVTQTKKVMQKNGEYVSGIFPYGYKRSDTDQKKLVPDPGCADIVKRIFAWRARGKGCIWIANYLNELALPSPGLYRYLNGCKGFKRSLNIKWKSKHVAGILTNPIYLGHMVQGKTRCSYFEQEGKLRFLPEEDWIIVEDTHEPLVTKELFDTAAEMAKDSRKRHQWQMNIHADVPHVDNCLRKKIYCGQCGGLLTRRSRVKDGRREYLYYCNGKATRMNAVCTNTHIHEIPFMEAVRRAVDQQLRLLGNWQSQWSRQKKAAVLAEKGSRISDRKRALNNEIRILKRKKQELYADMKEGMLSLDDFGAERQRLTGMLHQCEKEMEHLLQGGKLEKELEEVLCEHRQKIMELEDDSISDELLDSLIEKIVVLSPERIEITYAFTDLMRMQEQIMTKRGGESDEWICGEVSEDIG